MRKYIIILFIINFFVISPVLAADPYEGKQWYLDNIRAKEAWNISKGSSSVIVAVLDTGVDLDQPDLAANIWTNSDEIAGDGIDNDHNGYVDDVHGWDFVNSRATPVPAFIGNYNFVAINHGTFVSGLISAIHDNSIGIKGATAVVKIMPLLVLGSDGEGGSYYVTQAINYAVANGASVINMSFGGNQYSSELKAAIDNAYKKGVVVVAAAGNVGDGGASGSDLTNDPIYPICYDQEFGQNEILGVLATDKSNRVTNFTNYGQGCIDIGAPGYDIVSLGYQDDSKTDYKSYVREGWMGSSFASALVAGAAALLKSVNYNLTPAQIINTIISESGLLVAPDQKYSGKVGSGVLDIKKAMDKIIAGGYNNPPDNGNTGSTGNTGNTGSTGNSSPYIPPNQNVTPSTPSTNQFLTNNFTLYVSQVSGGKGVARGFDYKLNKIKELEVFKGTSFHGLNIQLVDANGDGYRELVAAGVKGDQPFVRVISLFNDTIEYSFLAYDAKFRGGVEASAGDVDGDGKVEIVVVPQSGAEPMVKIFDRDGKLEKQFLAFNKDYRNGLSVRVGDVDKDGKIDIVIAPHEKIMPKVKIFDGAGKLKTSILAYTADFEGGVNIALGDINKDGQLEIITGAGPGGGPHVKAFSYNGTKLVDIFAYASNFSGGVNVASRDVNSDGYSEIITAPESKGGPHVRIFSKEGTVLGEFFAWEKNYTKGINIDVY